MKIVRLILLMLIQMLGCILTGGKYKADLVNQWKIGSKSLDEYYSNKNVTT